MSRTSTRVLGIIVSAVLASLAAAQGAPGWKVVGWNDLGMHCMDADYEVFSILPPYNTIHAQVIDPAGHRITDPTIAGLTVTFEAVADPSGSINSTSAAKTNFWDHVTSLFGVGLPVDAGLAGSSMPGVANLPQPMTFEPAFEWFTAEGIALTPYDDGYRTSFYPMMRIVLRDDAGLLLASTDIVLPVSDEMTCRACHASGTEVDARPSAGWANRIDVEGDYRTNILTLHDERQSANPDYANALAVAGHEPGGLLATVEAGRSILCASCHPSNALPGSGIAGLTQLTTAMHAGHAEVTDPSNGMTLDESANRSACYACHPGAATRCLRGAMGAAVEASGELAMQCQNCHGSMSAVGAAQRVGWLDQPACQNCHTGTAVRNNGQIRYLDAFSSPGQLREAIDDTFATNPDTPAPGFSLYRFSAGHGGLQCEACHGSTHAVYPSAHGNDNIQSQQLQGHAGALVECTACHAISPVTIDGGPHGMHPVGQAWVDDHGPLSEEMDHLRCRACHGLDYRSTELSVSQANRTLDVDQPVDKVFWKGFRIGCYACHNGPDSSSVNLNLAATVQNENVATPFATPVDVSLAAVDNDGPLPLELRVVTQPEHGLAGLVGNLATYTPFPGYAGTDEFTFAAWDGEIDSNLGRVTVQVAAPEAPPPVPDGAITSGDDLRIVGLPGDLLRVEWDVLSCPSPGYHLVWYDLDNISTYTITDLDCSAGATGEWVGVPPMSNVAVIVVADDLAEVEGSHGVDGAALERPSAATACGFTVKRTDGTCP